MPVLPSKENTSDITEGLAKNTSSKTESTKATAQDHTSKGPQIPNEMPPKASREEVEAKMKELNQ